jgi:hypothetical protein
MGRKARKTAYEAVKSIVAQLRGKRTYNGHPLKHRNRKVTVDSQRLLVLTICSLREAAGYKLHRVWIERVVDSLNHTDVRHVMSVLSDLDEALLNDQYTPFKRMESTQTDGCSETFEKNFYKLISAFIHDWFINRKVTSFASLHQILAFCNRISLKLKELRQAAYDKWWATECIAPKKVAKTPQGRLVRNYISKWFPTEAKEEFYEPFLPHHGTGQVAEYAGNPGTTPADKYKVIVLDWSMYLFLKQIGYPIEGGASPFLRVDKTGSVFKQPCIVIFVNKNWKTFRTISMERTTAMFLQQGVGRCIEKWIKSGKCGLQPHYAITSEWKNRWLTHIGSTNGYYVTIDLSSASDSVMWDHVKWLTAKSCLNYAVQCLRTKYVKHVPNACCPSEYSITSQTKYAPMGARLCFPVMTIVLSAICAVACDLTGQPHSIGDYPMFVVYGDDIVCSRYIYNKVVELLEFFGFSLNRTKTFNDYKPDFCFRESCGAEYLNGVDVCPIRLSRNGFEGLPNKKIPIDDYTINDFKQYANLIELSNAAFRRIDFVRWYILDLFDEYDIPVAFDFDGKTGVKSCNPTYRGTKYRRRWNADLQRYEVQALSLYQVPLDIPCGLTSNVELHQMPRPEQYDNDKSYRKALKEFEDVYRVAYEKSSLGQQYLYDSLMGLELKGDDPQGKRSIFGINDDKTSVLGWVEDFNPIPMLRFGSLT